MINNSLNVYYFLPEHQLLLEKIKNKMKKENLNWIIVCGTWVSGKDTCVENLIFRNKRRLVPIVVEKPFRKKQFSLVIIDFERMVTSLGESTIYNQTNNILKEKLINITAELLAYLSMIISIAMLYERLYYIGLSKENEEFLRKLCDIINLPDFCELSPQKVLLNNYEFINDELLRELLRVIRCDMSQNLIKIIRNILIHYYYSMRKRRKSFFPIRLVIYLKNFLKTFIKREESYIEIFNYPSSHNTLLSNFNNFIQKFQEIFREFENSNKEKTLTKVIIILEGGEFFNPLSCIFVNRIPLMDFCSNQSDYISDYSKLITDYIKYCPFMNNYFRTKNWDFILIPLLSEEYEQEMCNHNFIYYKYENNKKYFNLALSLVIDPCQRFFSSYKLRDKVCNDYFKFFNIFDRCKKFC